MSTRNVLRRNWYYDTAMVINNKIDKTIFSKFKFPDSFFNSSFSLPIHLQQEFVINKFYKIKNEKRKTCNL